MLHKIYGCVIAVVLLILAFVGYKAFKAHDAWKDLQAKLAVSQVLEKQNNKVVQQATVVETKATANIAADTAKNTAIDADTKRKLASIDERTAKQLSSDDVRAILKEEMPKLDIQKTKDAAGNDVLAVVDNQANRDILNHADGAYKTCKYSLDDCQQKQANFFDIIKQKEDFAVAQKQIIDAQGNTIDLLHKDLKEATSFGKGGNIWSRTGRVMFPVGCAGLAAWGASQANASPKVIGIVSISSGAVCAWKF